MLEGIFDTEGSSRRIVVTGSAEFDYYRRRGDSLASRYRYLRLHPSSLRELDSKPSVSHLDVLLRFAGFPEPLFRQDESEHRIWQRDRLARVVREVSLVEQLVGLLPERVGASLSVANLRQDLEADHRNVERWLTILENMYICFRLPPFGAPRIRAVKKEKKLYFLLNRLAFSAMSPTLFGLDSEGSGRASESTPPVPTGRSSGERQPYRPSRPRPALLPAGTTGNKMPLVAKRQK